MTPYFVFLAITMLLAYFAYKGDKPKRIFVLLLYIVMSLFAGARSITVGTDTGAYARTFENSTYLYREIGHGITALTKEPGFYYLQKWLGQLSNDYYILLTGIALIFCFIVIFSLSKQSRIPVLSLFVFITLGYYTFVFNAARQGIAMAIYMLSIPYIFKRNFWKYTLLVLCAALFHKTVIIAIPLYFFFSMRFSMRSVFLTVLGGITVGLLLPVLLDFGATLEERYELYETGNATGGYFLTLFYVILALFFIIQRNSIRVESRPLYDIFLNMLLVGSSIYLVVSLTGAYVELTRFSAYFQLGVVFLWPMLINDRKAPLSKVVLSVAFLGHLGYFALFLSRMANLTPYTFNTELINGLF